MTTPNDPPNGSDLQQTNRDHAKGFQTKVEGGTAYIADTINQTYYTDRPRKAGVPFQMPPLPAHFIQRPEHEQPLKTKLLCQDAVAPGTLVVSAIHGLGGIGKSVLATKLAHDPDVQTRFADGILWVTLGQNPDLLPQLTGWIRALGDYDYPPTTLDAAATHLRTLLYDKAVLLVVDDVWNPDHAKPFRVGSDRCRMLITTRRADVADEADAELYSLDLMTPAQSLQLLSARLGRELANTEQKEALRLAKAVGYLPIALDLVAARISRGVSWGDLYDALEGEVARLEALEGPQRRRRGETRLEASFNLSLTALQSEVPDIWENFIWLGVLPEDVMVAAPLVTTLWGVTVQEAADRLELLWNDALLLPGSAIAVGDRTYPSYRIHDLLHDIACRLLNAQPPTGLGLTLPAAHADLLQRYQTQTQQGHWHTLPDDGYIHAHLTWHLEQAQQLEVLHQLLQETTPEDRNGWYEACERLGQTASFVTDVARAWQLAEQQYPQNPSQSIALQVRYALITTTLNSLAKNIPAELMAALVEKGVWTTAQGLAYARQAQESEQRSAAIQSLAPHLSPGLLPVALEIARSVQDESSRSNVLRGLAQYLPEAIPEALQVVHDLQDESDRVNALRELAQYLPEGLLPEALQVARDLQDEYYQVYALRGLAQYLPEVIPEALELARSIQDEFYRVSVLSGLAQYLPEGLLPEALQVTRDFQNESDRATALCELAQYLPAGLLPEALQVVRDFQNEYYRVDALSGLAQYLPAELLPEALQVARDFQNEYYRAKALRGLVQYLPAGLLLEALELVRFI